MNSYIVRVNNKQLTTAIKNCTEMYNNVKNFIETYAHKNVLLLKTRNTYYFSVLRTDTNNGIQVCISPTTQYLEIYIIRSGKKNIDNWNNHNNYSNYSDIINIIKNVVMYDYTQQDKCNDVYAKIKNTCVNTNYIIEKKEYIINITIDNCGYYIYFDSKTYANIGIIQNNQYFDIDRISVDNYQELISKLIELISEQYMHKIAYYDIIDTKYLECDMSEHNMNQTNDSLNSSFDCDPT